MPPDFTHKFHFWSRFAHRTPAVMINCNSLIYFVAMETTCVLLGVFNEPFVYVRANRSHEHKLTKHFQFRWVQNWIQSEKYGKLNKLVWIGRSLFSTFAVRLLRTSELNMPTTIGHQRTLYTRNHATTFGSCTQKKENFSNNLLDGKWYRVSSIYDYDCVDFFFATICYGSVNAHELKRQRSNCCFSFFSLSLYVR